MENTQNYLQILEESLNRKITILDELEKLTMSQREIVQADDFDDEGFNTNVEQKAALIRELEKLDRGFQILFDNVKKQLDENRAQYAEEIRRLQELVKGIMDRSTELQVMEARNKDMIKSRFAALKKEARTIKKSREMAANYYKTMNNISSEPYFMDKKK